MSRDSDSSRDSAADPNAAFLRNIQYRGGSYAILRCFKDHPTGAELTKKQIIRGAQSYCDEDMDTDFRAGRLISGWKSIESLEKHKLVHRISKFHSRAANGFKGCTPDLFVLSREGESFIERMLQKWPATDASSASQPRGGSASRRPHAETFAAWGGFGVHAPSHEEQALSLEDERRLEAWARAAQPPDVLEFAVSHGRRKHLHHACDRLRVALGLALRHESYDSPSGRVLRVRIEAGGATPARGGSGHVLGGGGGGSSDARAAAAAAAQRRAAAAAAATPPGPPLLPLVTPPSGKRPLGAPRAFGGLESVDEANEWACGACTLCNDASRDACEACGTRKPEGGSQGGGSRQSQGGASRKRARRDETPTIVLDESPPRDEERSPRAELVLFVDERERQSNANPLGMYLGLSGALGEMSSSGGTRRRVDAGVVVERKRVGDLVARSASGDHMEQLRRLALHRELASRAFLLLEDDPSTADAHVAYGAAGGSETVVATHDEVLELLAALLVDEMHTARPLLSSGPIESRRLLVRLTCALASAPPPRDGAAVHGWNAAAGKPAAATQRAALREALLRAGCDVEAAERICLAAGCTEALRRVLRGAAPAARPLLLCPLLRHSCADGGAEAECCALSRRLVREVGGFDGGEVAVVDLTNEAEGGAMARSVRIVASHAFASRGWLEAARLLRGVDGEWLQMRAEQGERHSCWYEACFLESVKFEQFITAELAELSDALTAGLRRAASSDHQCSCELIAVARKLASSLISGPLAANTDRKAGGNTGKKSVLVVVGLPAVRRRAGAPNHGDLYRQTAWMLAQTTLLLLSLEHEWHVHAANNADGAKRFVNALKRAVYRHALLTHV
ncbi:hypothetical protein AB1Y20_008946 [Prymnesium parvum]|uniref:RanBP2-type domain-containing protein n=1 Tax=Prymnesium parvum TaxID=97485 RepID=A0AB34K2Z3_PRYPA